MVLYSFLLLNTSLAKSMVLVHSLSSLLPLFMYPSFVRLSRKYRKTKEKASLISLRDKDEKNSWSVLGVRNWGNKKIPILVVGTFCQWDESIPEPRSIALNLEPPRNYAPIEKGACSQVGKNLWKICIPKEKREELPSTRKNEVIKISWYWQDNIKKFSWVLGTSYLLIFGGKTVAIDSNF